MHPILFNIGPVPIRSFGLLMVIAFFVGLHLSTRRAERLGVDKAKVWDLGVWLILAGALGARVLYILQDWKHYSANTNEIWSLQFNGLTSFGGLIGGLLMLVFYARKHKLSSRTLLDVFAPGLLVAHAIGRVGCLLNGCCFGGDTSMWFGVHQDGQKGLFVPAQLADSAMVLIAWGLLTMIERRRPLAPGQSFAFAIIGYNVSRFFYEFLRAGSSSTYWGALPITEAQALAVALAALGAVMFIVWRGRRVESAAA